MFSTISIIILGILNCKSSTHNGCFQRVSQFKLIGIFLLFKAETRYHCDSKDHKWVPFGALFAIKVQGPQLSQKQSLNLICNPLI